MKYRPEIKSRIVAATIASALSLSPVSAWTAPVTINLQGTYSTVAGGDLVVADTIQYDPDTGNFSATLPESQAVIGPVVKIIIITICLLFCTTKKEGSQSASADDKKSLLDLARGELRETVTSDLGAAGQAVFSSRLTQTGSDITASVHADMTSVDLSMLPALTAMFDVSTFALVNSTGPGRAAGTSQTDLAGLLISSSAVYTSLGDPAANFGRRSFNTELTAIGVGPGSYDISGRTRANIVSEPGAIGLASLGLIALAILRRRSSRRVPVVLAAS